MKHIIKPAASLFLIAAVITTLIGLVYRLTLEPIAYQYRITQERTMRDVFPQAGEFREINVNLTGNMVRVFEGIRAGEILGYVIELNPDGYSGKINLMVGISRADNNITGMRILKHTETPGLGSHAARAGFYRRFDGRALRPLAVVKTYPGLDEIEALTSATITTRAITYAVNEAIEWYMQGGFR